MQHIRRRQFLSTAGALLAAPSSATAQQPQRVYRIAFFYFGTRQAALDTGRYEAFLPTYEPLRSATQTIPIIVTATVDPVAVSRSRWRGPVATSPA